MDAKERIRKLVVLGENQLKQGLPSKARESFEEALLLARGAGLEDTAGRLVTGRIEDLDRVEAGARKTPPSA